MGGPLGGWSTGDGHRKTGRVLLQLGQGYLQDGAEPGMGQAGGDQLGQLLGKQPAAMACLRMP